MLDSLIGKQQCPGYYLKEEVKESQQELTPMTREEVMDMLRKLTYQPTNQGER